MITASSISSLRSILSPALSFAGGCPDFVEAEDLIVLDDLANSGALDIYGVLASELRDHPNGIEQFIAFFSTLADDVRTGNSSVFRMIEPTLIGAIQTDSSPTDATGLRGRRRLPGGRGLHQHGLRPALRRRGLGPLVHLERAHASPDPGERRR